MSNVLPTPVMDWHAPITPGLPPQPVPQAPAAGPDGAVPLQVSWARHLDELRAAQRLRHRVFAQEMGATLDSPLPGHDIDAFDDYCEHLLVRDAERGEVIGTYRVLTPAQAARAGGLYSEGEFDLSPIAEWLPQAVEMGRSCVHADWRNGAVILALWAELAAFMSRNQLRVMLGCASVPMHWPGVARHGAAAAAIWHGLKDKHLTTPERRVRPHHPLPVHELQDPALAAAVEAPALIRGYLRMGARLLGPPAWDPHFNTADLPILLHIADLPPRYRRLLGMG
ncbi:ornithine-acyl-ACP acyltransferase [Comamonas serinivorans]|uniref:L-ornithine N(alpha)-acyltransferase n=1 Tax=Comamonas serinivorans TaxID=1082851 RepID=A0A1Y0EKA0_9BURK|nr:GNAT family N-acetyltransferase [Comamonas serinivorans]ARU03712.1 ornithine-acyl-ACP acyltransferase [Comamonas serinivorans]